MLLIICRQEMQDEEEQQYYDGVAKKSPWLEHNLRRLYLNQRGVPCVTLSCDLTCRAAFNGSASSAQSQLLLNEATEELMPMCVCNSSTSGE